MRQNCNQKWERRVVLKRIEIQICFNCIKIEKKIGYNNLTYSILSAQSAEASKIICSQHFLSFFNSAGKSKPHLPLC